MIDAAGRDTVNIVIDELHYGSIPDELTVENKMFQKNWENRKEAKIAWFVCQCWEKKEEGEGTEKIIILS